MHMQVIVHQALENGLTWVQAASAARSHPGPSRCIASAPQTTSGEGHVKADYLARQLMDVHAAEQKMQQQLDLTCSLGDRRHADDLQRSCVCLHTLHWQPVCASICRNKTCKLLNGHMHIGSSQRAHPSVLGHAVVRRVQQLHLVLVAQPQKRGQQAVHGPQQDAAPLVSLGTCNSSLGQHNLERNLQCHSLWHGFGVRAQGYRR